MGKSYNLIVSLPGEAPAHFSLSARKIIIGRDPAHPITIDAIAVSSLHCELCLTDKGYTVADSGSRNGTRVNGTPIDSAPVLLKTGDQILLGETATAQIVEIAQVVEVKDDYEDDYDEPMINPVAAAVASATQKLR